MYYLVMNMPLGPSISDTCACPELRFRDLPCISALGTATQAFADVNTFRTTSTATQLPQRFVYATRTHVNSTPYPFLEFPASDRDTTISSADLGGSRNLPLPSRNYLSVSMCILCIFRSRFFFIIYIHTCTSISLLTYIYIYIHMYACVYSYTHTQKRCTYKHMYMYTICASLSRARGA